MKIWGKSGENHRKIRQKSIAWCINVPCTHHAVEGALEVRAEGGEGRAAISVVRPLLAFVSMDLLGDPPGKAAMGRA
jgi:hypothetical protein